MRDDFIDDDETLEEEDEATNLNDTPPAKASKAWRSIERLREMKELRKHLDDLLDDEGNIADYKDLL